MLCTFKPGQGFAGEVAALQVMRVSIVYWALHHHIHEASATCQVAKLSSWPLRSVSASTAAKHTVQLHERHNTRM